MKPATSLFEASPFEAPPFEPGRCVLVGMVHCLPLPGSPGWGGSMARVIDRAMEDAEALFRGGCDALLVENMGDRPYLKGRALPETVGAMAVVTAAVTELGLPVGVQVLAGANREALGVAVAAGARFLRAEGFAWGHVADEGWIEASAGPLLRARAALGAEVRIWADVRKKHAAHAATADLPLIDLARGTAFCGADALVITGAFTGAPTRPEDVQEARGAGLPVVVGSGVTPDDAPRWAELADAVIVGSALKRGGRWQEPVDPGRVAALAEALRAG